MKKLLILGVSLYILAGTPINAADVHFKNKSGGDLWVQGYKYISNVVGTIIGPYKVKNNKTRSFISTAAKYMEVQWARSKSTLEAGRKDGSYTTPGTASIKSIKVKSNLSHEMGW